MNNYPSDIDLLWLASDSVGQIAGFTTAGLGPVPTAVNAALDDLGPETYEALLGLTKTSDVDVKIRVPKMDGIMLLGERGFFVYDWTDVSRYQNESKLNAYELMARPTLPLLFDSLPEVLRRLVALVRLKGVTFQGCSTVDVLNEVECLVQSGLTFCKGDKAHSSPRRRQQ